MDKFYRNLEEAKKRGWPVTFSTRDYPSHFLKEYGPHMMNNMTIKNMGLRYNHSYTMLDLKVVKLANNYTDILVLLRNPTGEFVKGEMWNGDWGPDCDLWSKHTKE